MMFHYPFPLKPLFGCHTVSVCGSMYAYVCLCVYTYIHVQESLCMYLQNMYIVNINTFIYIYIYLYVIYAYYTTNSIQCHCHFTVHKDIKVHTGAATMQGPVSPLQHWDVSWAAGCEVLWFNFFQQRKHKLYSLGKKSFGSLVVSW